MRALVGAGTRQKADEAARQQQAATRLQDLVDRKPDHVQANHALLLADADDLGARARRLGAVSVLHEELARVHHVDPRRLMASDLVGAVLCDGFGFGEAHDGHRGVGEDHCGDHVVVLWRGRRGGCE